MKFKARKYVPGIQLLISIVLLLITIILLFSSLKFVNAHSLLIILLLAFFVQSLIVPYFVFKIINLDKIADTNAEKIKVFTFCNSFLAIHKDFLRDSTILYSELENNFGEKPTQSNFESSSSLSKKIQTTRSKLDYQRTLFSEITNLQNKILKADREWLNINEFILSSLKKSLKLNTKNTIIFHVNPKLKLVQLDKMCLQYILETIIEVAFKDVDGEVTIQINLTYKKPYLKIGLEINNPVFSKQKFHLLLAEYYNKNLPQTYNDEMDLTFFESYLMVNHGKMIFEESEKENYSILTLLLNTKHSSKKKSKD